MLEFNATFLAAMFSFIVFILIMNAIFYKPILGVIGERNKYINDLYEDAKNSTNQAEKLLKDKEKRLSDTMIEAKKIVSDKTAEANSDAGNRISDAKKDSALKIQAAKDDLKYQEAQLESSLDLNVRELADVIAGKILGEN